jgi:glycosyltransferase involved in cell wall biosynthesis
VTAVAAPLVTVCIPTIGRTATLVQTLASATRQRYPNQEVLVLDNASGPEGRAVIDAYLTREPRARLLRSERRLPMFDNFARGIDAARGRYVTFFHDDDVYLPRFLERQVELLETDDEIAFAGSNWTVIDEHDRVVRHRALIKSTTVWPGHRYTLAVLRMGVNIVPMAGVVFRASLLSPEIFSRHLQPSFSDFAVLMRMAEGRRVGLIDECLVQVRSHRGQESRALPPHLAAPLLTSVLEEYLAEFAERWPDERRFHRRLQRGAARARRTLLLWGWLTSPRDEEARRCAAALDRGPLELALRQGLRGLQLVGLGGSSGRGAFAAAARRFGAAVLSRAL